MGPAQNRLNGAYSVQGSPVTLVDPVTRPLLFKCIICKTIGGPFIFNQGGKAGH